MSLLLFLCGLSIAGNTPTVYHMTEDIMPVFNNKSIFYSEKLYSTVVFEAADNTKRFTHHTRIITTQSFAEFNKAAVNESLTTVVKEDVVFSKCEINSIKFYFVRSSEYKILPSPLDITNVGNDYYVFVCQQCDTTEREQIRQAYIAIADWACPSRTCDF